MTSDAAASAPDAALIALVEIAGRDSVAAAVRAVEERPDIRTLLPTVVVTGTEYGDREAPLRAVAFLRERLGERVRVEEPAHVGSVPLWRALNARYAAELSRRFGVCSPCLACHLYMHLARVPLAWLVGARTLVTGERDSHGGRLKLSQLPQAIDASVDVLAHAGIELLTPIRHLHSSQEVEALLGTQWPQEGRQLECVLAGNYIALDGEVRCDAEGYGRYIREFFVPAGIAVIDAWREAVATGEPDAEEPDYQTVVAEVLGKAGERAR